MPQPKFAPRAEYRQQERQRIYESISLSEKFPELESLTVEFGYFSPEGITRNSQIKYTVNPDHAKSVFRLDCMNDECVGGDFDLSQTLTEAVARRKSSVTGEMRCQGWLSKAVIDRVHCHDILRFKLTITYGKSRPMEYVPMPAV